MRIKVQTVFYYSEVKKPFVEWVFKFFSAAIGCKFCPIAEACHASVIYAKEPGTREQVHIPLTRDHAGPDHGCLQDGYWIPETSQRGAAPIDYVGYVFRLLTLLDERSIADDLRDPLGNISWHPRFLQPTLSPIVDEVVQALKRTLIERHILHEEDLLPRWPDRKRYAVVITHDTDGPCLLEPKELAKAGIKGLIRGDRGEMQAFLEGCWRTMANGSDPYFNFSKWAEFEQSLRAKSAFYIYARCKQVPNHMHNPLYRIQQSQTRWHILRELAASGWEIGLHASIHALEKDEYVQAEKDALEQFLGQPVTGNRNHYWSINWRDPEDSLRRLAAIGMTYDCSIAWKDRPGFRSATVTPYHPYDSRQHTGLTLVEIPTNLMDGHLFEYQQSSDPYAWFLSTVEQVKAHEGVLNLDWHTRTWVNKFSYKGWRTFLLKQLKKLAETGEVWFTTPKELSEYWVVREQQIEGDLHENTNSFCGSL